MSRQGQSKLQKSTGASQQGKERVERAVPKRTDAEVAFAQSLAWHLRSLYEPKAGLGTLSDLVDQLCQVLDGRNPKKQ
jgi:hypothetical protein